MRISYISRFLNNNKYNMFLNNFIDIKTNEKISVYLNINDKQIFWNFDVMNASNFNKDQSIFITNIITFYKKYKESGYNIRYIPFYYHCPDYTDVVNIGLVDRLFLAEDHIKNTNKNLFNQIHTQLNIDCYDNIVYKNNVNYINYINKNIDEYEKLAYILNKDHQYAHLKSSKYHILCDSDRYMKYLTINSQLCPMEQIHYSICDKTHNIPFEYMTTIKKLFDFNDEYKDNLYIVEHQKEKYLRKLYILEDIIFDNLYNIEKDVYADIDDIEMYIKDKLNI